MKGVREYYDRMAADWAERWYADASMLPLLQAFLAGLPEHPRVLDLCCGAGYESMRLASLGAQVVGLDLSGESIRIARERNPQLEFHIGDMLEDYTALGPLDGVACIAGLVHLPQDLLALALRRMAEAMKPGGRALIVVRDGTGRLSLQSDVVIDGERYDRAFYAHTREEMADAAAGLLHFEREIPGDETSLWRNYIFAKD